MIMEIHWDDLKIFLAVARAQKVSGAGRQLKVDAATVARRIRRLEEQLGCQLFIKSPQGYDLTDDGHRLLVHAEQAEQAVLLASADVGGATGRLTGQVRIGAPDGCANYVLPQVCAKIATDNPGLDLQIVALPRVFNLSRREADIAIAVSTPTTGRQTVKKITDYHLHLAASKSYLSQHGEINSLETLKKHRIVGYIPDLIFDKELDYLDQIGVESADIASNSVSVQFNLVRQGAGIGIVHDFALPTAPDMVKVLPDAVSLTRSFYLIRHADDQRVERLNRVAQALTDGVRHEVAVLEGKLDM